MCVCVVKLRRGRQQMLVVKMEQTEVGWAEGVWCVEYFCTGGTCVLLVPDGLTRTEPIGTAHCHCHC